MGSNRKALIFECFSFWIHDCYNGTYISYMKQVKNMSFQVPSVSIDQLLKLDNPIVDVRTPKEFDEFSIPGAINLPLFSNEERVQVGTTYKQVEHEAAKKLGLKLVSTKWTGIYEQIHSLYEETGTDVVVHCWRGGMRSRTVVSLLSSLGIPCIQLEGGIRSFRKFIVEQLETLSQSLPSFIVLEGLTGTRKTEILRSLKHEGYPVLDLEGLAGHRGSLFGAIGLTQNSQKQFESLLWKRLYELKEAPYIMIEAESKRIGNVILPDFILERKQSGIRIHLNYPFGRRVKDLISDYQPHQHVQEFENASSRILKRIDPKVKKDFVQALEEQDYFQLFSILLETYYDPRYRHASRQYDTKVIEISMEQVQEGISQVKKVVDSLEIANHS